MLKPKSHLNLAVVLVAATMLIAGSVAIASNTGFKINKGLTFTGAGQIGSNWLSIPYFNPYTNGAAFCTQTGLRGGLIGPTTITKLDPVSGNNASMSCGASSANTFTITPGLGINVRPPATVGGVANPSSIIVVGSHNPSLSLTIPKPGAGNIGNFWFAVPYHTTAVTAADICSSIGLTSTGFLNKGSVARLNPANGNFTTFTCGGSGAFTLVLGEAVKVREPNGPLTFTPAHF